MVQISEAVVESSEQASIREALLRAKGGLIAVGGLGLMVGVAWFHYDVQGGKLVSERVVEDNWNVAVSASAIGTLECVDAWLEDFRDDLPRNDVPTLILHGDADRILPPDATSRRQAKMISNCKFVELKDGPHGLLWTHAERINSELVAFLK